MKKVLPLLLFVLMAFAGCQNGPAVYEITQDPHEIVVNAEKFVKQVDKKSKRYSAEDWDATIDQFVQMSENYVEFGNHMTAEEKMRFDNARVRFMGAIDANGSEELAIRVKEAYAKVLGK